MSADQVITKGWRFFLFEPRCVRSCSYFSDSWIIFVRSSDEGGVFKSRKPTGYSADEIQDSWETKTDLPLDQRKAEEVEVWY